MSITLDRDLCTACEACIEACPFGAIEMVDDAASITDACTLCGSCEDVCPVGAITIEKKKAAVAGGDWSGVWIFAEQREGTIAPVSFELLGAGRKLADRLGVTLSAVVFRQRSAGCCRAADRVRRGQGFCGRP